MNLFQKQWLEVKSNKASIEKKKSSYTPPCLRVSIVDVDNVEGVEAAWASV